MKGSEGDETVLKKIWMYIRQLIQKRTGTFRGKLSMWTYDLNSSLTVLGYLLTKFLDGCFIVIFGAHNIYRAGNIAFEDKPATPLECSW